MEAACPSQSVPASADSAAMPQGRRIAWRQPVWDKGLFAHGCTRQEAERQFRADLQRTLGELTALKTNVTRLQDELAALKATVARIAQELGLPPT